MKKFTIVFPTKNRPALLKNILDSVQSKTSNLDSIEVFVAFDHDDPVTKEFFQENKYSFIRTFQVQKSLNFSRDYYSMMARQGTGRWVLVVNDDAEFVTERWDVIADETLKMACEGKPDIIYGWIEDDLGKYRLSQFCNYCCFPVMGRQGVDALGYVFPDRIPTWGADLWARHLYDAINRVVVVPITIRHICHHNQTREQDEISKLVEKNYQHGPVAPNRVEIKTLNLLLGRKPYDPFADRGLLR
jgi:glycosyltransferase involved in cell wall biosynthesis